MKRITLVVGLDVDDDTQAPDVIQDVEMAIAEHVRSLSDTLWQTCDGVHVTQALENRSTDEPKTSELARDVSGRQRHDMSPVGDSQIFDTLMSETALARAQYSREFKES